MSNKIVWGIFFALTLILTGYILFFTKLQPAGDIVEYYGVTESILNHGSIDLSDLDKKNLSASFGTGQFNDPNYYIKGKDGKRYPGHFILYSFLAVPVRIALIFFQVDEVKTLAITNLIVITLTVFYLLKRFLLKLQEQIALLVLMYLSPLIFFITWPGPDLFYLSLLLIALFLFFSKSFIQALILVSIASWHSQPLTTLALFGLGFYAYIQTIDTKTQEDKLKNVKRIIPFSLFIFVLLTVPYLYNYAIFGALTPWTIFKDGWTQLYGFGLQNVSLKKLFEQFFDPNIGLFWYAPLILVFGLAFFLRTIKRNKYAIWVLFALIVTAFFYQTNPAWNYGTAGFGPTRHVLFMIPFLLYFIISGLRESSKTVGILLAIGLAQVYPLSFNGFLTPKFENSLYHNPIAIYVLTTFPAVYNSTPEIFVDRTNHTDLKYITTAIYKDQEVCKKAYVLLTDGNYLVTQCGSIPKDYGNQLVNEFLQKVSFSRKVKTNEATFWPDPDSCADWFTPTKEKPYVCMRTIDEVTKYTGVQNSNRFGLVDNFHYPGIWKLKQGDIVEITIPPGYIINYKSFEGIYVNY